MIRRGTASEDIANPLHVRMVNRRAISRRCMRDLVTLVTKNSKLHKAKVPAIVFELLVQAIGPESLVSYLPFRTRATQHYKLRELMLLAHADSRV